MWTFSISFSCCCCCYCCCLTYTIRRDIRKRREQQNGKKNWINLWKDGSKKIVHQPIHNTHIQILSKWMEKKYNFLSHIILLLCPVHICMCAHFPIEWVDLLEWVAWHGVKRNGNGHKYTKNVCMTGHNIKYHQYRMLNFLSISP